MTPPEKTPTSAAKPKEDVDLFDLLNKVDGYDPNINTVETETSSDKDWLPELEIINRIAFQIYIPSVLLLKIEDEKEVFYNE